jgi:hypothetical protein
MEQSPKGQYGYGRVAFKTYLKEIHQEIESGYTLIHIYDKRKDKLGITYSQFAKYVGKYITGGGVRKSSTEHTVQVDPMTSAEAKSFSYVPQPVTPKKGLNDPTPLTDDELF